MQAARRRLVHAASAELRLEALITFEDAIRVLQQRNERLQQILDEKTLKLKQLQWESLATKHDSERRIRYLEKRNAQLWREKVSDHHHQPQLQAQPKRALSATDGQIGIDSSQDNSTTDASTQPHVCRPSRHRILRVDASNCSYEQYLQYAKSSTPVIFTGWSVPKWTLESLRATCGEADVVLKAQQHTRHNLNSRVGSSAWAGIQTVAKAKLSAFIDDLTNSSSNLTKPGW